MKELRAALIYPPSFGEHERVSAAALATLQAGPLGQPVLIAHYATEPPLGTLASVWRDEWVLGGTLSVLEGMPMDELQSVGAGFTDVGSHYEPDGTRVIDRLELVEVSLLAEPPRPELGVYPIEFAGGKPRYSVEELAAIWAPVLGAAAALRYAQERYGQTP